MFNRINKFQFTLALLILAAMTAAIYKASTTQASGLTGMESVIVQLKDDPAAVYRAKIQKSGGSVSDQQLQSCRNGLRASQDQFLTALRARGVTFSIDSVDIKGFDGATAASVQYRYTMVLDGVGLTLPKASLSILKSMSQVKSVSPNSK